MAHGGRAPYQADSHDRTFLRVAEADVTDLVARRDHHGGEAVVEGAEPDGGLEIIRIANSHVAEHTFAAHEGADETGQPKHREPFVELAGWEIEVHEHISVRV